jgi:hypothetical protein
VQIGIVVAGHERSGQHLGWTFEIRRRLPNGSRRERAHHTLAPNQTTSGAPTCTSVSPQRWQANSRLQRRTWRVRGRFSRGPGWTPQGRRCSGRLRRTMIEHRISARGSKHATDAVHASNYTGRHRRRHQRLTWQVQGWSAQHLRRVVQQAGGPGFTGRPTTHHCRRNC